MIEILCDDSTSCKEACDNNDYHRSRQRQTFNMSVKSMRYILRKTIEGYLDSVPSLTSNTIITKLIMHAFHSSRYL